MVKLYYEKNHMLEFKKNLIRFYEIFSDKYFRYNIYYII